MGLGTKKSTSYTRLTTHTQPSGYEGGLDKQKDKDKIGLKYVRSKEILRNMPYNKSSGDIKADYTRDLRDLRDREKQK